MRGNKETTKLLEDVEKIAGVPAVSPICVAEVQTGVKRGEEDKTNNFFESLKMYVLDRNIANEAGKYIREYKEKGMTLLIPNALIAATCSAVFQPLYMATEMGRSYSESLKSP